MISVVGDTRLDLSQAQLAAPEATLTKVSPVGAVARRCKMVARSISPPAAIEISASVITSAVRGCDRLPPFGQILAIAAAVASVGFGGKWLGCASSVPDACWVWRGVAAGSGGRHGLSYARWAAQA